MFSRYILKREFWMFCLITIGFNLWLNGGIYLALTAGTTPEGEPCDSGATAGPHTNLAGDATGDGALSTHDPLRILAFLFAGGDPPVQHCAVSDPKPEPTPVDALTSEELIKLRFLLAHLEILDPADNDNVEFLTLRLSGVNLQLVNGLGATNGYPDDPYTSSTMLTNVNGLGNLIIGYNEERADPPDPEEFLETERTGSHNLIVGARHNYTSFGGLVAGRCNQTAGPFGVCAGGTYNKTSSIYSTIIGGCRNVASAAAAQVTGGRNNTAAANYSTVVGGGGPEPEDGNDIIAPGAGYLGADARYGTVIGGRANLANRTYAVVCGGMFNVANGESSVVVGGGGETAEEGNVARANYSVVGGGSSNTTLEENLAGDPVVASVVVGGRNNSTSGNFATVSGGGGPDPVDGNTASGDYSAVSAGRGNISAGEASCVGGGLAEEASGAFDFRAGDELFSDE